MRRSVRIGNDGDDWISSECGDRAVLTRKHKPRRTWTACTTIVDHKPGTAVKDQTGRISLRAARSGNRKERSGCGTDVEERCLALAVVGNPPGRCGSCIQSPRVNQVGILVVCYPGLVGYDVVLGVKL